MDYVFTFSVDPGAVSPNVGEVISEVNRHMADFGFREKLVVRSEALTINVSGLPNELKPDALTKIADSLLADLRKFKPEWAVQYEGVEPYSPKNLGG